MILWQLLLLALCPYLVPFCVAIPASLATAEFNSSMAECSSQELAADGGLGDASNEPQVNRTGRTMKRCGGGGGGRRGAVARRPKVEEASLGVAFDSDAEDAGADNDLIPKCWLCAEQINDEGIWRWRSHPLHKASCASALRCHMSLLRNASAHVKAADAKRLERDPEGWKCCVLRLNPPVNGCNRPPNLVNSYAQDLEAFASSFRDEQDLLLPKARFKAYHKFWDGWASDSASEEFDVRLQEQGTDNESGDEPRVWTKDNTSMHRQSGIQRRKPFGSGSEGRVRDRGGLASGSADGRRCRGPGGEGGRRRVGRCDSESRDRGRRRSRSRSNRRRAAVASCASSRRHQADSAADSGIDDSISTRGSGRRNSKAESPGSGCHGSPKAPSLSPASNSSKDKGDKSGHQSQLDSNRGRAPAHRHSAKKPGSIVFLTDDEGVADKWELAPTAKGFLSKKAQLKKEIDAEYRKRGTKSAPMQSLQVVVARLTDDDKIELRRTGDVEALGKSYDDLMKRLRELQMQLTDVDQDPEGFGKI